MDYVNDNSALFQVKVEELEKRLSMYKKSKVSTFFISGVFDTIEQLQTKKPTGKNGEAYFVRSTTPYSVYCWDINSNSWQYCGALQGNTGEKGDKGDKGDNGQSFRPRGAYSSSVVYENTPMAIDTLYLDGTSYYCKKTAPAGTPVTNEEYFGRLLETNLTDVTGNINSLSAKIDSMTSTVTSLTSRVDNIISDLDKIKTLFREIFRSHCVADANFNVDIDSARFSTFDDIFTRSINDLCFVIGQYYEIRG